MVSRTTNPKPVLDKRSIAAASWWSIPTLVSAASIESG